MQHSVLDSWNAISLRTKITGVTVLVLTFGLLISGLGTLAMLKPVLQQQLDNQLIAASQNPNPYMPGNGTADGKVSGTAGSVSYFVALYDGNGNLIDHNWRSKTAGDLPNIPKTLTLQDGVDCAAEGVTTRESVDGHSEFRSLCTVVSFTNSNPTPAGTAIVAASTGQNDAIIASYLSISLGIGILVVVFGAVLTGMLVGNTFAPLRQVELTAAAIADGDFSQRLGGATPNTEVGRLNRSLNTMLNRIDRAFKDRARTIEQMRRFVGDASHELRTPLVSVRGYAELYRMGALQKPEDVAQAMERIEKEAIRMGGLVENLLQLARLDETRPLELMPVDLLPLAKDAALDATAAHPGRAVTVTTSLPPVSVPLPAPSARPESGNALVHPPGPGATSTGPISFAGATLARLRGRRPRRAELDTDTVPLELHEIPEPVTVQAIVFAEENKLRQVLNNLIGNAVRYTPDDSPIEIGVVVDRDTRRARLDVIDHGDGIPEQIREKIFQRFWRADTSRTRETGGSGLGLAIVSSIVAAHNGTVDVVETPGGGATFQVWLPLADSPNAPQGGVMQNQPPAP
ncbi:MAG: HAMP domain-containing histidine kinase [Microbacteriaceae bacterium]|nr:MAG: HAMP domain-containing histidine kinase [Microbacteriaceae bacterium]